LKPEQNTLCELLKINLKSSVGFGIRRKIASSLRPKFFSNTAVVFSNNFERKYFALLRLGAQTN